MSEQGKERKKVPLCKRVMSDGPNNPVLRPLRVRLSNPEYQRSSSGDSPSGKRSITLQPRNSYFRASLPNIEPPMYSGLARLDFLRVA